MTVTGGTAEPAVRGAAWARARGTHGPATRGTAGTPVRGAARARARGTHGPATRGTAGPAPGSAAGTAAGAGGRRGGRARPADPDVAESAGPARIRCPAPAPAPAPAGRAASREVATGRRRSPPASCHNRAAGVAPAPEGRHRPARTAVAGWTSLRAPLAAGHREHADPDHDGPTADTDAQAGRRGHPAEGSGRPSPGADQEAATAVRAADRKSQHLAFRQEMYGNR
jgi:hypothetical protein